MKTQPQKRVWVILICPADSNVMNEFDTFLCMAWLKKKQFNLFFYSSLLLLFITYKDCVYFAAFFFCFYFCFVFSVVKCNWFDFTFSWREPWVVAAWIELQFREKATDSTVQLCDWPWQVASIQSLRGWKSSPRSETPCSACYSIQVARGIPPWVRHLPPDGRPVRPPILLHIAVCTTRPGNRWPAWSVQTWCRS